MKFICTTEGYINAAYVKRLYVQDKRIVAEVSNKSEFGWQRYILDEEFADDESAQNYLDELIEELEKE